MDFLIEALDHAKEEIAPGYKEALTDYHQLKREVRESEAELCARHKSAAEAEDLAYLGHLRKETIGSKSSQIRGLKG